MARWRSYLSKNFRVLKRAKLLRLITVTKSKFSITFRRLSDARVVSRTGPDRLDDRSGSVSGGRGPVTRRRPRAARAGKIGGCDWCVLEMVSIGRVKINPYNYGGEKSNQLSNNRANASKSS